MRTFVYVDGFNLYYGALKGTTFKWLNLRRLCELLLPRYDVRKIKYFTAHIRARPHDPDQPTRQQTYLRALETLPGVEIILGHFLTSEVSMPLVGTAPGQPQFARVVKTEEKGSDVNIAAHLLNDGYKGEYEAAFLITNDSDLLEPIRLVRQELALPVGIINPHKKPSKALLQYASTVKQIRKGVLAASQFPPTLQDANGVFRKSSSW